MEAGDWDWIGLLLTLRMVCRSARVRVKMGFPRPMLVTVWWFLVSVVDGGDDRCLERTDAKNHGAYRCGYLAARIPCVS